MTATRVRRLKLNGAQLRRFAAFMTAASQASQLGIGLAHAQAAREEWGCMDSVARSAVRRLGLVPQLTALGCIPPAQ